MAEPKKQPETLPVKKVEVTAIAKFKYQPKRQIGSIQNIKALAGTSKQSLVHLLPKHANVERLIGQVALAATKNPTILQCSQESIARCIAAAANTGLDVSGVTGQAAIVPYYNSKAGCYDAQFIPMYKGLIDLATRSGRVLAIECHIVYANDEWTVKEGTDPIVEVTPCMTGDRGEPIFGYLVTTLKGAEGGIVKQVETMRWDEIMRIAARSKAKNGPWKTDRIEMGRKTVFKRGFKYVPSATENLELMAAIQLDNDAQGLDDIEEPGVRGAEIISASIKDEKCGEPAQ